MIERGAPPRFGDRFDWRNRPAANNIPSNIRQPMLTLHLTNGDIAASALARSGLPGDILTWRDLLHDGPVPSDRDRVAFRRARGEFLASRGWSRESALIADFEERDARLDGITADDEVVLWFEPDLYDQLQLLQVLSRLAERPDHERPVVSIAPADCYLGPLAPNKFVPLFEARRAIRDADLALGQAAWEAFTSPTPDALLAVTDRLDREVTARAYAYDDSERLPHLVAALRRQLEEYPDTKAGLSRSERQLCEALAPGTITLAKLFAAHQTTESWVWLGDSSFAWYVQRLSDCSHPLVVHTNGSRVIAPPGDSDSRSFWDRTVQLTPLGHDVVRDRADHVRQNGIDRWIGGVHCHAGQYWRWDPHHYRLVAQGA